MNIAPIGLTSLRGMFELAEMVRHTCLGRAEHRRYVTWVPWQKSNRRNCLLVLAAHWVVKHTAMKLFCKPCFPGDISMLGIQLSHLKLCKSYQLAFTWTEWPFQMVIAVLFAQVCIFYVYFHVLSITCTCDWCQFSPTSQDLRGNSRLMENAVYSVFGRKTICLHPDFCDYKGGLAGLLYQHKGLSSLFCIYCTDVSCEWDVYLLEAWSWEIDS